MHGVEFMTDEWIDALDTAARSRTAGEDDPLAEVTLVLEQVVDDRAWRLVVDRGAVSVRWSAPDDAAADVRLTCARDVAVAVARGDRPALDAFMHGDLRIGGDVAALMKHRAALEVLGDLFATIAPVR